MTNKAYIDDEGIICEAYEGVEDGPSIQDMVAQTTPLIEQIKGRKLPVRILVDLTSMRSISLHGRQAASEALKTWHYQKIAVYGANLYMRHIANLILLATNKGRKVKLFPSQAAARAWLKEAA